MLRLSSCIKSLAFRQPLAASLVFSQPLPAFQVSRRAFSGDLDFSGKRGTQKYDDDDDEILTGPFGNPEKPVMVPSINESRVVGCLGGPGEELEHPLTWHHVKEDKPTICVECGQTFKLRKIIPSPDHIHDEDEDDHH